MADGSYYEGEFENGEINGHGFKYFSLSGNTYSGEFHLGELQGQGVMNYTNGAVYEGQWTENRRDGKINVIFISVTDLFFKLILKFICFSHRPRVYKCFYLAEFLCAFCIFLK
jgi:hypothetical protein